MNLLRGSLSLAIGALLGVVYASSATAQATPPPGQGIQLNNTEPKQNDSEKKADKPSGDLPAPKMKKADKPDKKSASGMQAKGKGNAKNVLIPKKVVLVFPIDTKGGVSDQLSDVITDVVEARLKTTGDYSTLYFLRSNPRIQRALAEQSLTPEDTRPPFDSNPKVVKLTQLIGYKMVLVGGLLDYKYDEDKKQISLILSARLIDLSGEKPRIIRSVTVTGSSAENAAPDEKDAKPAIAVARDAAERLMTDLLKPVKPGTPGGATETGSAGGGSK